MAKKRDPTFDRPTQLTIPGDYTTSRPKPKAAQAQLTTGDWDQVMTTLARKNHPGAHWWWGTRRIADKTGGYCYVCSTWIVHYARNWAIPKSAIITIERHRESHYLEALREMENQ